LVVLLDGSTFRLRPHGDIPEHFPRHRSGKCSQPYWCVARTLAAFCLGTGAVLDCVVGSLHQSEQALASQLMAGSRWLKTLFLGDRNFGVYSVVRSARQASAHVLVRLTKVRARRLAKASGHRLHSGLDALIDWTPTRHDQCPEALSKTPVPGRLLAFRVRRAGLRPLNLYLFTTLTDAATFSPSALVQLYGQRWQVELDLRFVKAQLDLHTLECKTANMARKEWLAGLLAYNLVRSLMALAAAKNKLPIQILSFSRTRQMLLQWLVRWAGRNGAKARQAWELLLSRVAKCRQPCRTKPRAPEFRGIRYCKQDYPKLVGDRALLRQKLKIANVKS
jgi:hypothetical protein